MDSKENYEKFLEWFLRVPIFMSLVRALFFSEVVWLLKLIGVLFIIWSILDMINIYQMGNRKLYRYMADVLIMAGSVYMIILAGG